MTSGVGSVGSALEAQEVSEYVATSDALVLMKSRLVTFFMLSPSLVRKAMSGRIQLGTVVTSAGSDLLSSEGQKQGTPQGAIAF